MVVVGCSAFGVSSEPDEPAPPAADAGVVDAAVIDASTCVELELPDGDAGSTEWVLLGSARTEQGDVVLTDATQKAAGALWKKLPHPARSVVIDADLLVDTVDAHAADGFAIAWTAADLAGRAPPLGGYGQFLGVCGDGNGVDGGLLEEGHALALITYGTGTAESRRIALFDLSLPACGARDESVRTNVQLGTTMHAQLEVTETSVTGTVNGQDVSRSLPISGAVTWVGFGAATQTYYSRQAVRHVHIRACE